MEIGEKLIYWAVERNIKSQPVSRNGLCANITEELGEWLNAFDENDEHEKVDALADIVVFAMVEMTKMRYHPDKVMIEAHKEINSRTGAWDENIQKWVKNKSPEAKKLWYKADFSDCKI